MASMTKNSFVSQAVLWTGCVITIVGLFFGQSRIVFVTRLNPCFVGNGSVVLWICIRNRAIKEILVSGDWCTLLLSDLDTLRFLV